MQEIAPLIYDSFTSVSLGPAIMSQQCQMTAAPLWKLAGVALLLASFSVSAWILVHAVVAADHLVETVVEFVQNTAPIFRPDDHNVLTP